MKKSASVLLKAAGITAGVIGAAGYVTFLELMHRNAKLATAIGSKFVGESGLPAENPENEARVAWFNNQIFEEFEIVNDKGFKLRGYFLPSEKPSNVYVFGSHGYRGNGKTEFCSMTKFYHDKGYNVFLVDHQAAGESEGKYIGFGYHEYTDCFKWLDFIHERFGNDIQIILHGVSMGCATVTMMSGSEKLPETVKFTVADCGYTSAYDEFMHNVKSIRIPATPVMAAANQFNRLISGYQFKDANPLEAVKNAKVPMLFIHGSKDTFVPTEMVYKLYDACSSADKDLLVVEGAAHAESYPMDSASYEAKVCAFADKYIR